MVRRCPTLIYRQRPAPDTPIGYFLSHFHAYVLQRIPLDTLLSPNWGAVLTGLLIILSGRSLIRFSYGTIWLARMLTSALPFSGIHTASPAV